jgi:hypothetical protein
MRNGQAGRRSRFGWVRAVFATGAVGAALALSAVNAIPLGHPPKKEPPPGVQLATPILAFDPLPSGGGGGTGN